MTRSLALATAGLLFIGGVGCGGGGVPDIGAPLPVRDGTWFRYIDEARRSSKFPRFTTIRFEDAGERTFRYIETFRVESRDRPDMSEDNPQPALLLREDGVILRFADEDLRPSTLGEEQVMNRLAKIWLSRENRVPGAEVRLEGFPDNRRQIHDLAGESCRTKNRNRKANA